LAIGKKEEGEYKEELWAKFLLPEWVVAGGQNQKKEFRPKNKDSCNFAAERFVGPSTEGGTGGTKKKRKEKYC